MNDQNISTIDSGVAPATIGNLQRLHENLSKKDGFNVPFDQFESDMQDENNLKRLHGNLSTKDNFNVPYEQFKTDMWGAPPEIKPSENQSVPASVEVGFGERMAAHGKKGLADLYSWAADLPKTAYRIAAIPQNAIATATGADWLRADPEKISERLGIKNPVSEYYQGVSDQQEKIIQKDTTSDDGVIDAFTNKQYATGFKNLAGSLIESAPSTIAMMLSGAGSLKAMETAKATGQVLPYVLAQLKSYAPVTGIFAGGKLQELDKEAPDMPDEVKASIALGSGFVEQLFERQFGAGAVGEAFTKIIKNEGKDKARAIIGKGIKTTFSDLLTKYPALSPIGEGFEEMGTQITQNIIDKYSGYRPDLKVTDGVLDAGLAGVTMGGVFAGGLSAAKAVAGTEDINKTPAPSTDSTPIPTIDPRSQAEMAAREFHKANANPDTGMLKTIQEVTQIWTPNNTRFVRQEWDEPGEEEGTTRHMYAVTMPDGSIKQFQSGQGIIENDDALTEDQYANQQLAMFDQQQPKGGEPGAPPVDPVLKAQIEKETAPAYSHDGVEIPRDEALKLIKLAAKLKDKSELAGLTYSNDPEIDAIIEKAWPKPPVLLKIKGIKVDRDDALTRIKYAKSIDKLNELRMENIESDPELQRAYEAKIKQLTPAKFALTKETTSPEQALMHIKYANDLNDLQQLNIDDFNSDKKVREAYDAMVREFTPSQIQGQSGEVASVNMEPAQGKAQVAPVETSITVDPSITDKQTGTGKNRIVTDERYQELKRRMKEKLNTLNSGLDPELLAIGAEMAAYHIETGVRQFGEFSKQMVADLGENIKPHLKALYNDARNLAGMEQHRITMDSPEDVKMADIDSLLSQGNSPISTQGATLSAGSGAATTKTPTTGAVLGDSGNSMPLNVLRINQETKLGGERNEAVNQTAGKVPPRSVNPKVEESMKSAHGIKGEPIMDKFRRWGQEVKETSQHFAHITESEFPGPYNKLRLFEAIPDKVKKEAFENISRVVRPIVKDKALFEAFERHIVLQDLLGDVRRGMFEGKELPWGYRNENEIQQDADRMTEFVNNNPPLVRVLNARQTMMNEVRDQLIENGILSPKTKANDNYFHHQVLEFMEARQRQDVGVSGRDAKLHNKGWQQSRVGSMKAYNTNYLESEFEVLAQSLEKLEIKKMLNKIGAETNIMTSLVEKSNAENYNVAQFNLKVTNAKDKQKYTTWRDFIPEGYKPWFPKAGSNAYKAATFAERAAQNMMINADREVAENIEELIAEADLSMWVIPEKIAKQLDTMRSPEKEIIPIRIMRKFNNWWKQWILLNPFRVLKYNANNMSGDLDIVLAYNPEILKPEYAHTATKELWSDLKGNGMSKDIKEALEQGVITSGMSIQEIPDINKEGVFKSLTGDDNLIVKYWGASKGYTQFRENLLRIAAYKFFKDQLNKGKIVYGVSEKKSIDALTDVNEKAGKLARELIGDYGNLSQGGQWLRSHVYPFWSWIEINTPRYYRLLKNTANEGQSAAGTGARVAGVVAKKTATNVLTTSAKMLLFAGLVSLWNWTWFSDEDEELSKTGNRQLRLILGRREDGSIMTIRISGAFSDMLSFVGLEDAPQDFRDLKAGDTTIGKKVKEAGSAFANKIAQGMMPIEKTAAEVAMGKSLYPDVFDPRTIRDKAEHALKTFSMDRIYRYLTKKPLRRLGKEVEGLIVYDTDPGEAAYYTVRQKIYDFMKQEGIENTSGEPTQRSNALFYYKQSLKLKNQKLAEYWLQEFINEGGTKEGYKTSLQRGVVTSPLPKPLREKWWDTLDSEDKELFDIANQWYETTYLGLEQPTDPEDQRPENKRTGTKK